MLTQRLEVSSVHQRHRGGVSIIRCIHWGTFPYKADHRL